MVQLSNFVRALAEVGYCRRSLKMRPNVFTGAETIFRCPERLEATVLEHWAELERRFGGTNSGT